MDSKTRAEIGREEVFESLRRVLGDPAFARAPQLRRLLVYLMEQSLAGDRQLKEYTIAVDALGRPASFDPVSDASVRVQAGRLRRALEKYYTGNGRDDPVRIVLPVGSYAIACERQGSQGDAPASPAAPWWRSRSVALSAAAALIAIALVVSVLHGVWSEGPQSLRLAAVAPARVANGMPTIVIMPFEGPGADAENPMMIALRHGVAAVFARFETVNVVQVAQPQPGEQTAATAVAESVYVLSAVVTRGDDRLRLLFHLADQSAGTVVWTQAFEIPDNDGVAHQERIVRRLATTLVQTFGVIPSRERIHQLQTGRGDPRYRCILQAADALREARFDGYRNARACLEEVLAVDPHNSLASSYLSLILSRYFQYGPPEEADVREAALAAARRAVHDNPTSSRAHFALFVSRFNMRRFAAAETAMAQALALNDNDLVMRSEYAGRLVSAGRVDEGLAIFDQVEFAFPARSCTHGFYVFLGRYLKGDTQEARRHAAEITCPTYPYGFIAKALVAAAAGDMEAAKQLVAELTAAMPFWRSDARATLARMIPDAATVDRILRDLAPAGLAAADPN